MGFVKRVVIFFARPIYKGLIERPLWWFLARVKGFFFAETMDRLTAIEARLTALEKREDFNRIEAHTAAQWDAVEQLLLALIESAPSC